MEFSKLLLASAAVVGLVASSNRAEAAFPAPYPVVGVDTLGPEFILTVNPGGGLSIAGGPGLSQGPYDQSDDTYIGVVNNSGAPVTSFFLSSTTDIFGFDGDGIDSSGYLNQPNNSKDTSGYGGPLAYFTNIGTPCGSDDCGDVNFIGNGLAAGASTYFSLEEALSLQTITNVPTTPGTPSAPEPGSLALLGAGIAGLSALRRRKKA